MYFAAGNNAGGTTPDYLLAVIESGTTEPGAQLIFAIVSVAKRNDWVVPATGVAGIAVVTGGGTTGVNS